VPISLREGKSEPYRKALADGVHQAMVEAIEIPPEDRFQITTEHLANDLIYDPTYLGVQRSDDIVMVQITFVGWTQAWPKNENYFNEWRKSWPRIPACALRIS
jgi:hypothetical protein